MGSDSPLALVVSTVTLRGEGKHGSALARLAAANAALSVSEHGGWQ